MKQFSIILISGLIIFLAGCSGPKVVPTAVVSGKVKAEKASSEGDYTQAVEAWKQYFSEQAISETDGADYSTAAQAAFKIGDNTQSISWFDQARYKNFADAEMYSTLAKIYNSQQNISKELSALEYYRDHFTKKLNEVNSRLYEIYFEIKMYDKAQEAWLKMNENSKNEPSHLNSFFRLNKSLENNSVCDSLATVILEKEPLNVDALEWNGNKYYWQGENLYQREMEKYNKNKTNKQYKILLSELELATADFKKALPYFEKLWEIEPGEKYASYFANIYARFGDESKVGYYKKFMK
jgi:tetratricopeptide (TPR) repeat protein